MAEAAADGLFRLRFAMEPVDSKDVFLYHKTTHREVYEKAKGGMSDCDDVVLYNERGEVTETTIANIVVVKHGRKITPRVECGLLAGTFREHLLATGEIEEGVVTTEDLVRADRIYVINSVRRWVRAELSEKSATERHRIHIQSSDREPDNVGA